MIDMNTTYVTNLKVDDSTEKILHAIKKTLDTVNKKDQWSIDICNSPITGIHITVQVIKAEILE